MLPDKKAANKVVQAHIFYSGMVQGVGFRFYVQRLALGLKLVGWVRNIKDGRVEIIAEGEQEQIDQLMTAVGDHFAGYISKKDCIFDSPQGKFKSFMII